MYNFEDISVMDLTEIADELLRIASFRVMTRLSLGVDKHEDNTSDLVDSAIKLYKTIMESN